MRLGLLKYHVTSSDFHRRHILQTQRRAGECSSRMYQLLFSFCGQRLGKRYLPNGDVYSGSSLGVCSLLRGRSCGGVCGSRSVGWWSLHLSKPRYPEWGVRMLLWLSHFSLLSQNPQPMRWHHLCSGGVFHPYLFLSGNTPHAPPEVYLLGGS